ncbi:MAG TPA: triose-phosphate isomerase [Thermoleophilaceae bacterium]|nr:triose-phosphate isomerase [Thermoleophilaceae bacterium]
MTPEEGPGVPRRPAIVGNWKLWGTRAQAAPYCERLVELLPDEPRRPAAVGVCAPFTSLDVCLERLAGSGVAVYAQTMHQEENGAFTGEISAPMLNEIGVDGVVLGHSERRQFFCETDRALQEKVPAALTAGLRPILCVGESEEEREAGETERKLRHQVHEALERVTDARLAEVAIAYEPIWAIGTGKVATPEIAQDAIAFVRALVGDRSREAAERVRVQYGGSVKPDNAAEILAQPDVDGALVGGASLDPDDFARIIAAAAE